MHFSSLLGLRLAAAVGLFDDLAPRRSRGNHNPFADSRFQLDIADQTTVDPASEERVLRQQHNFNGNHNGGDLRFGPDGYLYWSTGDGGSADDPLYGAQNLSNLLGKLVRIDAMRECDGRLYCIPKDNPFARSTIGRPEIWAWGLRPVAVLVRLDDGSRWIGDVGQNRWEEINHTPLRPSRDGWNFGWSCREGLDIHRVPASQGEGPDPFIDIRCLPRWPTPIRSSPTRSPTTVAR